MFHIVALVVAMSHSLVFTGAGPFDTKDACEQYLASPPYELAVSALKDVLVTKGIDSEITSTCEPVE